MFIALAAAGMPSADAAVIVRSAGKPIEGEIVQEYNDFIVVKDGAGRETKIFKQHIVKIIGDTVSIPLKNGDTIEGVVREEHDGFIVVDTGNELLEIDRNDIADEMPATETAPHDARSSSVPDANVNEPDRGKVSENEYYEIPVEVGKFTYDVNRSPYGWQIDWRAKLENRSAYAQEVCLVVRYWDKDNLLLNCSFKQGIRLEPKERRTVRCSTPAERRDAQCIESVTVHIAPLE